MKPGRDWAIGVFDSGIGGLTVVREILRQLPGERIVYFGDTARAPYGNKSPKSLIRFALEDAKFLSSKKIKFLVVACNSSSAYSLPALQAGFPVPVLGVILAGARAATSAPGGKRPKLGVIGTHATISSGAYQRAIRDLNPRAKVFVKACPLFVPLAEEGWSGHKASEEIAREYLLPLKAKGIDTLVLGCTHYPLLRSVIARVLGPKIALVDSARETAREVKEVLRLSGSLSLKKNRPFSTHEFYVSDLPGRFGVMGRRFLGRPLPKVTQVVLGPKR
ncbi:MAG: glutamate racemase [candidate division FCPU426 bacterium]